MPSASRSTCRARCRCRHRVTARAAGVPGGTVIPSRSVAVWRGESDPACSRGGAAFRVAYPGRPGGRRVVRYRRTLTAKPRRGVRARYAGARLESGRGVCPSVTRPRLVHRPGRATRGGVRATFRVRVPVKVCLGERVPRARPGAVASPARKRCELDPRPAPSPLNIAVSIFESRPPYQGRTARAEDDRLTRRSRLISNLPTSPGNRIREPVRARAAPAKVLARALGYMTQRARQSGSWAANANSLLARQGGGAGMRVLALLRE